MHLFMQYNIIAFELIFTLLFKPGRHLHGDKQNQKEICLVPPWDGGLMVLFDVRNDWC